MVDITFPACVKMAITGFARSFFFNTTLGKIATAEIRHTNIIRHKNYKHLGILPIGPPYGEIAT